MARSFSFGETVMTRALLPPWKHGNFYPFNLYWWTLKISDCSGDLKFGGNTRNQSPNFARKTFYKRADVARRNLKFHELIRAALYNGGIYGNGRKHGRIRNRLTFSWIKSRYQSRCLKASLWERVNVTGFFMNAERKCAENMHTRARARMLGQTFLQTWKCKQK